MLFDIENIFFILGMRRSGTTITQALISRHPKVEQVFFEPHHIGFACRFRLNRRFRNFKKLDSIVELLRPSEPGLWKGAKFAINPGTDALLWKRFNRPFKKKPYFIFVMRNIEENRASWLKADRLKVPDNIFNWFYNTINMNLVDFHHHNGDRSCIIKYENLVNNANAELVKVWKLLGLEIPKINFQSFITKPKHWKE